MVVMEPKSNAKRRLFLMIASVMLFTLSQAVRQKVPHNHEVS